MFFTRDGVFIYIIQNLYKKKDEKKISVIPLTYRVEITKDSIDDVIDIKGVAENESA